MRAVLCKEFGPPESLVIEEVPSPALGSGQVRVHVEACGVNFPDTLIIENKYQFKPGLPFSPGGEVAGVICEVGDGVSGWKVGDRVIVMCGWGGFDDRCSRQARPANQARRDHANPVQALSVRTSTSSQGI